MQLGGMKFLSESFRQLVGVASKMYPEAHPLANIT